METREERLSDERDVTLWPTRENYDRFAALCDDEVPSTFDEFEAHALKQLADLAAQGIIIQKIAFNPDKMAQWCRARFGTVNAETRSIYAGFLALSD